MRKLMMIAALLVASLNVNAQEVGMFIKPMAGATLTTMTGDVNDLKMKVGFTGGAELGYQFHKMVALTAGALYTMQGARVSNDDNKYMINTNYLNVPVLLNLYPVSGFGIKAGVQFGFMTDAHSKVQNEDKLEGRKVTIDYSIDYKDDFEKFDLSIPVGISYQFSNPFVIDARYQVGVTKLNKESGHGVKDLKNGVFLITFGYKFAL
jgi:hypothetical protein